MPNDHNRSPAQPTLVIGGELDPLRHNEDHSDKTNVTISGAGHFPHNITHPEEMYDVLEKFICNVSKNAKPEIEVVVHDELSLHISKFSYT